AINLDPAASTASRLMDLHDHVVARVDELLGDGLDLFPVVEPTLPHRPNRLQPVRRPSFLSDAVVDIRSKAGQGGSEVVAKNVFIELADDLHVLLRHRPRSISREGCDHVPCAPQTAGWLAVKNSFF